MNRRQFDRHLRSHRCQLHHHGGNHQVSLEGRTKHSTTRPKSFGWWEPRWSYVPRMLREIREIFAPQSCLRIVLVSAALVLAIYVAVELWLGPAMPAFRFNWLGAFAKGIGGIGVLLALHIILHVAIPPRVTISKRGIARQHGQAVRVTKHGDITAMHLVLRRVARHFIRVETAKRSQRIGLGRRVSLLALEERFGDKLVVHDRRGKSIERYSSSLKQ